MTTLKFEGKPEIILKQLFSLRERMAWGTIPQDFSTLSHRIGSNGESALKIEGYPTRMDERSIVLARLWDEFRRLNAEYFNNGLMLREIRLSTRKQYGGYYRKLDGLIVLSWQAYCDYGWEETLNTFRHEVAHIVYQDHSRQFWNLAIQLGCNRRYASPPLNREHAYCRYVYACPACGAKVFRRKRLQRASCAHCDSRYNPAYSLSLISAAIGGRRNAVSNRQAVSARM